MTEGENKAIEGSFDFDINEENKETFKKMLGLDIDERYAKGEETEEDLLEHFRHMVIVFEKDGKKQKLDVVEFKYYEKLVEIVKKYKQEIEKLQKENKITDE